MINDIISRYLVLQDCKLDLETALTIWIDCYRNGGKLLICGNGGSAADSGHIVGELMKGFLKKRPPIGQIAQRLGAQPDGALLLRLQQGLPAIDLTAQGPLLTAFANDVDADMAFAQQVLGYGAAGDVLVAITTSGNAANTCLAAQTARALGMKVVGLTGAGGGRLAELCDVCIRVPATHTPDVQELHLPVYHALCAATEAAFFRE